jgi:hypothetical protein
MRHSIGGRVFALADLMIAVAVTSLAVFLVCRPVHGHDDLEPNLISRQASHPELLLRIAGFAGVPPLAIAWYRQRVRRRVIAGESKSDIHAHEASQTPISKSVTDAGRCAQGIWRCVEDRSARTAIS